MSVRTRLKPLGILVPRSDQRLPALITLVVCVLVLPLFGILLLASLRPPASLPFADAGFTIENYVKILSDPFTHRLLLNTLAYAIASLTFALVITIAIVLLVERTDFPFKAFVGGAMFLPLAVPGAVSAFGWVTLLSERHGFINAGLRAISGSTEVSGPLDIYTFAGMVFLTGIGIVPGMFVMLSASFRNMDARMEEAGRISGATSITVARRLTVPIMLPSIAGAGIYYLIVVLEMFEIPLVIGTNARFPVIATYIFQQVHAPSGLPTYGVVAAFGVLALAIGLGLALVYARLTKAAYRYAVVTGRSAPPNPVKLRPLAKSLGLSFVGAFFTVTLFLPIAGLVWTSLFLRWTPPTLDALNHISLDVYRLVLVDPRLARAAANTLILVLSTATATALLATLVAWMVVRNRGRWARLLDSIAFLPLTIPAVVVALAIFLTLLPTPLYGTIWIIVLGLVVRSLPFAVRTMHATLLQLHPELEEASKVSGATEVVTMRHVVFPLLMPAVIGSWLWVAAHSIRDFTFPLMLGISTNLVIAQILWSFWTLGEVERASAMSVLLLLAVVGLVLPARYLSGRRHAS